MNSFTRHSFLAGSMLLILSGKLAGQSAASKIDELLKAYAALYQFNGSALVYWKGKTVLNRGYGFMDAEKQQSNSPQTIFQLGSITKQFTSTIILKLKASGRLNLDDTIAKFFPDIPWAGKVTIRHLLTHTSGIFNYTDDKVFMNQSAVKPASRNEIINLFKDKPLGFEPGTSFSYSNSAYMLLGYIIEDLTGRKYEQVVRDSILNPLKMGQSGFDFAGLNSRDKARGYITYTATLKMPSQYVDSSVSYSAGAMYSSAGDLLKWHHGLESGKILSASLQEEAYKPFLAQYGFGWVVDTIYGERRIGHGGGIFGFLTSFTRIPEEDGCIILLSNSNTSKLESIHPKILAILKEKPYELPKQRVAVTLDPGLLKQYNGAYQTTSGRQFIIDFENGFLTIQASGQPKLALQAEKKDFFFATVADAQVVFHRTRENAVDEFILYQGGKEIQAKKIK